MNVKKPTVKKLELEVKKLKKKPDRLDTILQSLRVKQRNIDHLYMEIENIKKGLTQAQSKLVRLQSWLESHGDRLVKQETNSEEHRNDIDILVTRIDVLESDKK